MAPWPDELGVRSRGDRDAVKGRMRGRCAPAARRWARFSEVPVVFIIRMFGGVLDVVSVFGWGCGGGSGLVRC